MVMGERGETQPLTDSRTEADTVIATSTRSGGRHKTVHALLKSSSEVEVKDGYVFLRRLWALLVLQYVVALFLSCPFALLDPFQHAVKPYHGPLEAFAIAGIVASLLMALSKGPIWPYSQIALVLLTAFVGLELGLTFMGASWGRLGLVALGQAATQFSVVLAVLQFPVRELQWLTYPTAAMLCLCMSGLWILVLAMTGAGWKVAAGVGIGGWAFVVLNLFCCHHVTKYVSAEEYVLAALFVLFPEGLLCIASKQRQQHPDDGSDFNGNEEGVETK